MYHLEFRDIFMYEVQPHKRMASSSRDRRHEIITQLLQRPKNTTILQPRAFRSTYL